MYLSTNDETVRRASLNSLPWRIKHLYLYNPRLIYSVEKDVVLPGST